MRVDQVRRVLILGAGTMGQQIGLQCAMHGYAVTLYDISPEILNIAITRIEEYAAQLVGDRRLTRAEADDARSRIITTSLLEKAAEHVDLISESVPENPKLKGEVFAQFDKLCPPHTVFTTNTSTLLPSMFAKATGRPSQFAALHFHMNVWESNVVDIMPHPDTSEETVTLLLDFARRIGQIPILLRKEKSGYIVKSIMSALNHEALSLVANGIASAKDVDRALMGAMKVSIGPFGNMDRIGLDTVWHITDYWAKRRFYIRQIRKNANFLKEYVDKGQLGVKSGQGFYTYPDPAFRRPGFVEGTQ